MLGRDFLALWCLFDGNRSAPFKVSVHRGADVDDFEKAIKNEKQNALRDFDASRLVLWMVRFHLWGLHFHSWVLSGQLNDAEPVEPEHDLSQGSVATFARNWPLRKRYPRSFRNILSKTMFTYWCNFLPLMSSYCHLTITNLRLPLLPTFALTSHSLFLHTPITCYTFTATTTPIDGSRPFQGARLFSSAPGKPSQSFPSHHPQRPQ